MGRMIANTVDTLKNNVIAIERRIKEMQLETKNPFTEHGLRILNAELKINKTKLMLRGEDIPGE